MSWTKKILLTIVALLPALFIFAILGSGIERLLLVLQTLTTFGAGAGPASDSTTLISAATLIVTTISTISTIWLAWRGDLRESREAKLKIEQLELQLAQTKQGRGQSSP